MSYGANLWLFSLVLLGVIVLPGLDMAFVMASSLVDGRRSGLAAVAGIVAGGVCHVLMTALGLGVLLAVWPSAFNAVLVAGAIYIAWIGWSLLRAGAAFDGVPATASRPVLFTERTATSTVMTESYRAAARAVTTSFFLENVRISVVPFPCMISTGPCVQRFGSSLSVREWLRNRLFGRHSANFRRPLRNRRMQAA